MQSNYFDTDILDRKFYLNQSSNDDNNETLLEACVNQGLIPEREEILEIIKTKEQNENRDSEVARYRIKEEVKSAVPSSIGLRECMKSVDSKYPYRKGKLYLMIFISFIMFIIAMGFYIFDVSTDIHVTERILSNSRRNFTEERIKCKENFDNEFNTAIKDCKTYFDSSLCIVTLSLLEKTAQGCFEDEDTGDQYAWSPAQCCLSPWQARTAWGTRGAETQNVPKKMSWCKTLGKKPKCN